MRVLLAHNSYLHPGGEDVAFEAEAELLRNRGHFVEIYSVRNEQISSLNRVTLAAKTLWNRQAQADVRRLIQLYRPDVLHLHNTFPLISPSVAEVGRSLGVPVVQTLHNYRLICPNAQLFRDGAPCHDCVGMFMPWPAVFHRCYRQSGIASAVAATSILELRLLRRLNRSPDVFVTLTEDARNRLVAAGLTANSIMVKPNFLSVDPGVRNGSGNFAVFAGRLAPEKGILTLLDAWSRMSKPIQLKVVGDGPLRSAVEAAAGRDPRIQFLGWRSRSDVIELIGNAAVLVFPSLWYEVLPMTIIESLAVGTPVIASRLGAMHEMVRQHEIGLHFTPGDAGDLARQISSFFDDGLEVAHLRAAARESYERRYTADRNYAMLTEIYAYARSVNDLTRCRMRSSNSPAGDAHG